MNDLLSLQKIFNEALFRIPDYQRGYSWNKTQLEEFWNDITSLLSNQDHYTGMISLKALKLSEINQFADRWITEKWLVDGGYAVYEVVDGQQRMTTLIILINEIVSYCKKNNILELNSTLLSEIEEKYLYKIKNNDIFRTYKFGYKEDNPSNLYFRHIILEEPNGGSVEETFYTLNLSIAKEFFGNRIKELVEKSGIGELENLFRKITLHLKFNMYYIEDDFNVFIAFETMNNRGKKLSYLELLKNRLIYLSTLFDNDEDEKSEVRKKINDTWKEIYSYLGKNKNHPLSDDEFLQNHWMIYFGYQTRKAQGNQTISYYTYLLNKYFIQQNIGSKNLYIPDFSEQVMADENEEEIEIGEINNIEEIEINDEGRIELTLDSINDYVNSLKNLIPYWYEMYFPNKNLDNEIAKYLFRLKELGHVNSKPLITVILSKDDISVEDKVNCLKQIERFNFLHYRLNGYISTYDNSAFYSMARDLYKNNTTKEEIFNAITKIDYLSSNKVITSEGVIEKFKRLFKRDGFYSWPTLKYLLYVYDLSDTETLAEQQLDSSDYFKQDPKDYCSIEHIYPQKAVDEYWVTRFNEYGENERKILSSSLGNLLPLSKRINSSLQNNSFELKKIRYAKGSRSEIKVANEKEWTPEAILQRGLTILSFMEKEWDFIMPNLAYKKKILGLNFMLKSEDEVTDVTEPINLEIQSPATRDIFYSEEDYVRLSANSDEKIRAIYKELDSYILSLGENIKKNSTNNYISYTNGKSFVEFHFYTNILNLTMMSGEYEDPLNKIKKLDEKKYKWSNMNRLDINPNEDIEYTKKLLKQSYEKTLIR